MFGEMHALIQHDDASLHMFPESAVEHEPLHMFLSSQIGYMELSS